MKVYSTILLSTQVPSLKDADKWFEEIRKNLQGKTDCKMHGTVNLQEKTAVITKQTDGEGSTVQD